MTRDRISVQLKFGRTRAQSASYKKNVVLLTITNFHKIKRNLTNYLM